MPSHTSYTAVPLQIMEREGHLELRKVRDTYEVNRSRYAAEARARGDADRRKRLRSPTRRSCSPVRRRRSASPAAARSRKTPPRVQSGKPDNGERWQMGD
jgi:hypothetical protein